MLGDYRPETVPIVCNDTVSFDVRGLTVADIEVIFDLHLKDMVQLRELLLGNTAVLDDPESSLAMFIDLVRAVPGLVATSVALAAGDLESASVVGILPLHVQVKAIDAVYRLTFGGPTGLNFIVGAMKKLAAEFSPNNQKPPGRATPIR